MRCKSVVGREVGVKCYGMQGCCAGGRPGVTLRSGHNAGIGEREEKQESEPGPSAPI